MRLALSFLVLVTLLSCEKKIPDVKGQVVFISGLAFLKHKGHGDWLEIKLRQEVSTGDFIRTNSKAIVHISVGKAIVKVAGDSKLVLTKLHNFKTPAQIDLNKGFLWAKVIKDKAGFRIATPTTVARVRGTSFSVSHGEDGSLICVCDGEVEVKKAGKIHKVKKGGGLVKYAIKMMNGARLGIACQSLGIMQQGYSLAKKYASERIQFDVTIDQLPPVRRLLDEMQARVHGCRALIYRSSEIVDKYFGLFERLRKEGLDERAIRRHDEASKFDKIAKVLTPLSKFTASELCCQVAYDAIQVHGGVGYTEEYNVAKVFRDARITSIYEGTTQLQVVAIIGSIVSGTRKGAHLDDFMKQELSALKDAKVKTEIADFWQSLSDLVVYYKSLSRDDRSHVALELSWHLSYTIICLFLATQVDLAKQIDHEILPDKQKALETYLRMAKAKIAGGITYVKSFKAEKKRVEA